MPSLALKRLFKSKKDRESNRENTKPEKSKTRYTDDAKARSCNLTDAFRRHTRLVSVDDGDTHPQSFAFIF